MNKLLKSILLSALMLASTSALAQESTPVAPQAQEQPAAAVDTSAPAPAADVTPNAADTPAPAPATAAAAPGTIGAPPEGMGQIVFFRERKFTGGAVSFKVREGQTELGKLSNGTYFVLPVTPGAHQYTVHSEAKDVLNLEVEAGETYYVSGSITMGFLAGRPNLSPSDQAAFDGLKAKLKATPALN